MSLLASLMLLATAPANAASPDTAAPVSTCDALAGEEIVATAASGACRVSGHLHPVKGSDIGFALWLPARWNGRFLMLGNGGYASAMPLAQMTRALAKGYAVAATDTGHEGDDPYFALGHPEAVADWGWRAVHETARKAQSLTRAYYGRAPRWSYFNGCSTGGHQAFSEAQRFPRDFDGIVAGAPGYDRVRLNAGFLWMFLSNHRRGDNLHPILEQSQLDLLARHTLLRCGKPGAGWLDHPGACHADPGALLCRPGQRKACLTAEQMTAARAIYAGPHDERHRPSSLVRRPEQSGNGRFIGAIRRTGASPCGPASGRSGRARGRPGTGGIFPSDVISNAQESFCRPASMPTVPICRLSRRRGQVAAMAWAGRSRGAFCRYAGLSGKGAGAHGGRFAFLPPEAAARCGPLRWRAEAGRCRYAGQHRGMGGSRERFYRWGCPCSEGQPSQRERVAVTTRPYIVTFLGLRIDDKETMLRTLYPPSNPMKPVCSTWATATASTMSAAARRVPSRLSFCTAGRAEAFHPAIAVCSIQRFTTFCCSTSAAAENPPSRRA
jgi:hypothetical protein